MIGYAFCASFCTHKKSLAALRELIGDGFDILPIMSENTYTTDTRFGKSEDLIREVEGLCQKKVIHTVLDAEPIGPQTVLDLLVIAPTTGNTLSKLARGIADSSVTMAAKAQLRSNRPVLIALASNDALSGNLESIGKLLNRKNVYFVPLCQDDPESKPHSLVCKFDKIRQSVDMALKGKQPKPLFEP